MIIEFWMNMEDGAFHKITACYGNVTLNMLNP